MPISSDGNCGSVGGVNTTCVGSVEGNCCSYLGYCGKNSSYCGSGCQPAFGLCGNPKVSTDGSCGGTNSIICWGSAMGNCCSRNGYCGSDSTYCGSGCQSAFGDCYGSTSNSSNSTSPTGASSSVPPTLSSTATSSARPESNTSTTDTVGFKAGVGVAAGVVGLALIGLIAWLFMRRRRPEKANVDVHEADEKRYYPPPTELPNDQQTHELPPNFSGELAGDAPKPPRYELPSDNYQVSTGGEHQQTATATHPISHTAH